MLRNAFVFGESYCFVTWDKDKVIYIQVCKAEIYNLDF